RLVLGGTDAIDVLHIGRIGVEHGIAVTHHLLVDEHCGATGILIPDIAEEPVIAIAFADIAFEIDPTAHREHTRGVSTRLRAIALYGIVRIFRFWRVNEDQAD